MTTAVLFPVLQFFNSTGTAPLAGGSIVTYTTGTTTPLATYLDSTGTAAPAIVPLDSGGRPNSGQGMWLNLTSAYDLIVYSGANGTGTTVLTITNYAPTQAGIAPNNASYVTVSSESALSAERVLTAGAGNSITDAGAGSTITISSTQVTNAQAGTSYTALASDCGKCLVFTSASAITLSLTAAATLGNGWYCTVAHQGQSTLTIDPNGGEIIGLGQTTQVLYGGQTVILWCNGTKFFQLMSNGAHHYRTFSSGTDIPNNDEFGSVTEYTGTGGHTFTPPGSAIGAGWYCYILNSGSGTLILDPNGSTLIDGATTKQLPPSTGAKLTFNGTNFISDLGNKLGTYFNPQTIGYTALGSDNNKVIFYTGAGGVTLAFTAAATLGAGWSCKVINQSAGNVTLDPNSSETINGGTTVVMGTLTACEVFCNGTLFVTNPKTPS